MRKFRNQPTELDGLKFDSRKEARRWSELLLLQRAGEITDLTRQVSFDLTVQGHHVCRYVADFKYIERGKQVVEDVKSKATITPLYKVKRALMKAVYGIQIKEV